MNTNESELKENAVNLSEGAELNANDLFEMVKDGSETEIETEYKDCSSTITLRCNHRKLVWVSNEYASVGLETVVASITDAGAVVTLYYTAGTLTLAFINPKFGYKISSGGKLHSLRINGKKVKPHKLN